MNTIIEGGDGEPLLLTPGQQPAECKKGCLQPSAPKPVSTDSDALLKKNYLKEFSTEAEKKEVRKNLGIDKISFKWANLEGSLYDNQEISELIQNILTELKKEATDTTSGIIKVATTELAPIGAALVKNTKENDNAANYDAVLDSIAFEREEEGYKTLGDYLRAKCPPTTKLSWKTKPNWDKSYWKNYPVSSITIAANTLSWGTNVNWSTCTLKWLDAEITLEDSNNKKSYIYNLDLTYTLDNGIFDIGDSKKVLGVITCVRNDFPEESKMVTSSEIYVTYKKDGYSQTKYMLYAVDPSNDRIPFTLVTLISMNGNTPKDISEWPSESTYKPFTKGLNGDMALGDGNGNKYYYLLTTKSSIADSDIKLLGNNIGQNWQKQSSTCSVIATRYGIANVNMTLYWYKYTDLINKANTMNFT